VSFDADLFSKEYQKAVRDLQTNEVMNLNDWLQSNELYTIVQTQDVTPSKHLVSRLPQK